MEKHTRKKSFYKLSLRQLAMVHFEYSRLKYPNVPLHAIPPPKFSESNSKELTKSILGYLEIHFVKAWRQSAEGRFRGGKTVLNVIGQTVQVEKPKWLPSMNKGHADISAIINGQFIGIEVKFGYDKLRPDQVRFANEIQASGGLYMVARDWDNFINQIILL